MYSRVQNVFLSLVCLCVTLQVTLAAPYTASKGKEFSSGYNLSKTLRAILGLQKRGNLALEEINYLFGNLTYSLNEMSDVNSRILADAGGFAVLQFIEEAVEYDCDCDYEYDDSCDCDDEVVNDAIEATLLLGFNTTAFNIQNLAWANGQVQSFGSLLLADLASTV